LPLAGTPGEHQDRYPAQRLRRRSPPLKHLFALLALSTACAQPAPAPEPRACARFLVDEQETAFHDPQVLSISDSNELYAISLGGKPLQGSQSGHTLALVLGELRLDASSWGSSGEQGDFTFQATAAQARAFADGLGVPALARVPWPCELGATLAPVGELAAGAEQQLLRFTLTNKGPEALWFVDGGRGRNELGRDNRFTIEIEREGERLETRALFDHGGLGVYRRLAPGESHELVLDLAHWNRLERAGEYVVRAIYEADLLPAGFEPGKALPPGWYSHLVRQRSVQASLAFQLR
jgi:hypothetical protein